MGLAFLGGDQEFAAKFFLFGYSTGNVGTKPNNQDVALGRQILNVVPFPGSLTYSIVPL